MKITSPETRHQNDVT